MTEMTAAELRRTLSCMDSETEILLENAYRGEQIEQEAMLRLYAGMTAESFTEMATALVARGYFERVEQGTFRITEAGRAAWDRILAAEHAQVVRNTETWQPR